MANQTNRETGETATGLARVLLIDIETFPNVCFTWDTWETNAIKVIRHRQVACYSWKWLGEDTVHWNGLPLYPGYAKDRFNNLAMMRDMHDLINKADVLVGHNIVRFDERRTNTDLAKNNLGPTSPHRLVDTCAFAKHKFDFNSNRLDDLGEFLGLGRKVKHRGFDMWEECMDGKPQAWKEFEGYNRGDVVLLEKVYLRLRPWMANHPDLNARDGVSGCPVCKSKNLTSRGWSVKVGGIKRPRFQCRDCGKWSCGQVVNSSGSWKFK